MNMTTCRPGAKERTQHMLTEESSMVMIIPRTEEHLPQILSCVAKAAEACRLGDRETLSITLATEEIFIYLCQDDHHEQTVEVSCAPKDYHLNVAFRFAESNLDYRAFNLTHQTDFDNEEDVLAVGLLLASRNVDQMHLSREHQNRLRLELIKERVFDAPDKQAILELAKASDCTTKIASPKETECFAQMTLTHCDLEQLPPLFTSPGKLQAMVAAGEYSCAVASTEGGGMAGGLFWQRGNANTLECFGPYVFSNEDAMAESNLRAELLNLCLMDLATTSAVGLVNRYPGGPLSGQDFDELGSYSVYRADGSTTTEIVYFRQLQEDAGAKSWAPPLLEDFLLQEYRRLVLPRDVEFIQDKDTEIESTHSVLTTSFQREQNVVTLRPLWPGRDMAQNVAQHVKLLADEGWKNISAELDLGVPWQTEFATALLKHGFTPRIVLPHAGQGDVILFRRPASLNSLVPDFVKSFEPYIPSQPGDVLKKKYKYDVLYRLNNNENVLGPPKAAQKAQADFLLGDSAIYPSGDSYHLRLKLAEHCNLHPDQFIVTNGANESITLLIKTFCESGDNIVTADKTYGGYEWVARFSGIGAKVIPLSDLAFDASAMLQASDQHTKVYFVCNPNNPTGTYWSKTQLIDFLEKIGDRSIVVLDEAYFEFVDKPDYPDGTSLISRYPNLVILRTFSKMYGLAGLRIGYLVGDIDVVNMIRRTAIVYSVNSIAQIAAEAALGDQEHILATREMVASGKDFLLKELSPLGLELGVGEGNYMTVKLPFSDSLAYRMMMREGVMVRMMTPFRFPDSIRITIAQNDAMRACAMALKNTINDIG